MITEIFLYKKNKFKIFLWLAMTFALRYGARIQLTPAERARVRSSAAREQRLGN